MPPPPWVPPPQPGRQDPQEGREYSPIFYREHRTEEAEDRVLEPIYSLQLRASVSPQGKVGMARRASGGCCRAKKMDNGSS